MLVYRRFTPRSRTFDVALELGTGEILGSAQLCGFARTLDDPFSRPAQR